MSVLIRLATEDDAVAMAEIYAPVVREGHRRCGVARALYAELLPRLGRQRFRTAIAGVTLPNPASVGLHESLGFTPVGVFRRVGFKFGRWHDVGFRERPFGAYPAEPPELLPVEGGAT